MLTAVSLGRSTEPKPENWGRWGPDDELGTLNYITPETVRHAAGLVKQGKVFGLGLPYDMKSPRGSTRVIQHYMTSTAQGAGQQPGFAEDMLTTWVHGTSHWDGIGHMFAQGKLYNGYDVEANAGERGLLKCGIHKAADKLVTRGVLIDLARYKGVRYLARDHLITVADMEGAARKQGVEFRQGDMILVHSGTDIIWHEQGPAGYWLRASSGIGWEVSQWLKQRRAAAVAVDNFHGEVSPPETEAVRRIGFPAFDKPVNYELIRNQGMIIGKLLQLDALAAACARDGAYEFMFVAAPLNIPFATGSPINPQAIK